MAKCKLNLTSSPTLRRSLHKLLKTYRHVVEDIESLRSEIENDYTCRKFHATRLGMRDQPELQGKVWKYDVKSQEINKHARESMRLICAFDKDSEILYGLWAYVRDGNDFVSPKEAWEAMKELREALAAAQAENLNQTLAGEDATSAPHI